MAAERRKRDSCLVEPAISKCESYIDMSHAQFSPNPEEDKLLDENVPLEARESVISLVRSLQQSKIHFYFKKKETAFYIYAVTFLAKNIQYVFLRFLLTLHLI